LKVHPGPDLGGGEIGALDPEGLVGGRQIVGIIKGEGANFILFPG